MPTALTTKLEAVNIILATINEGPVASIPAAASDFYGTQAETTLDEVSKEVQLEGWHFNTEYEVEITPSGGAIAVPTDALKIDFHDPSVKGFQKGLFMYDSEDFSTTSWGSSAKKMDIVYYRAFTDLPEAANRYISIRAARVFASRYQSDGDTYSFTSIDERQARARLISAEGFTNEANILNVSPGAYAVKRGSPLRGY
mgnify:FL=1